MSVPISSADVEAYRRDGAAPLRGVIPKGWVERLREGVEENLAAPGRYARFYTPEGAEGFFFGDYCNWRRIDAYREFVHESPAAQLAAELMGASRVNFFHEHVLVKEPITQEPTPWHHDQPYWVVDGQQVCSMWIPLDSVPRESTVEFIAGSHLSGNWYTPQSFTTRESHPSNEGNSVPDVNAHRDDYNILGWALEPGDCVVFHALTLHGAPGNSSSSRRRRAVAMRFTGDDARFTRRDGFMSPPFDDVDIAPGSLMDSEHFPVIWTAGT
ncbi:MAG: phytanoyl-CoA dioxygenase family protein [Chromatiales bacterium]|jgi:ectoine hydroxylase-related dioxygenase (phytanoyl-CoA dioxygenase family)|nr:phytanoyl-CoA dioxygenase family protein [Chromatiales bacterium]